VIAIAESAGAERSVGVITNVSVSVAIDEIRLTRVVAGVPTATEIVALATETVEVATAALAGATDRTPAPNAATATSATRL
jgi:hypothetical protein